MKNRPIIAVFGIALLLTLSLARLRASVQAAETTVTYSHQIAPILYANCATCHHPGGAGPFSLLTYQDAKRWAPQILTVTQSRFMPPWLPEPGFGDFSENRRLSDSDRSLLRTWIEAGTPSGDLSVAPPPPKFTGDWQLGTPDLVLAMDLPFTTPASGTDIFRSFVLQYPLGVTHSIRSMEILPGAAAVVHHANLLLDRGGSFRKQHPYIWRQGVPGMELVVDAGGTFDPDSHFLFWKPDSPGLKEPQGMEWHLDPGDDLILNLHLKPTGKSETIQARVGLYFSQTPATKRPMLLQLENDSALVIPAGKSNFVVEDQLKIPIAVTALGIYPHAHYLGKDLQAWAILPNGKKVWLIWIPDWDIDRQSVYRYREPILLPSETVLHMRYVYDNSDANPRNPHSPPIEVHAGNRSEDEMGHLWLQVLPVNPLTNGKDSRLLLEQAWMAARLRKAPNDPVALYNLASATNELGNPAEAIPLYNRILERNPTDSRTLTALGAALSTSGDWQHAATSLLQALAINPQQDDARFDLANLYLTHNQLPQAQQQFRDLIGHTPNDAAAHSGLAITLLHQDQLAEARAEFGRALSIDPANRPAVEGLGELALRQGDPHEAIGKFEQAITLSDDPDTRQQLALAFAQTGQLGDAATQLQSAIRLRPKDPALHALLSQVDGSLGLSPDAISEQQLALKLDPNDPDGWNNLGVLHARSGEKALARQDFQKALQLSPTHAQAQANLERLQPPHPHSP
jgi:Flp pilus assembly protein TadD/mono/diheme cytochrome c family protein